MVTFQAHARLLEGDCLEVLRGFEANTFDSLVTDPPAGISFMGKGWDSDKGGRKEWTAWLSEVMRECLRVLKPGAHGLVWAIPRTSHWTATALEDAGFDVRDVITHLFGQGFPKSLNIALAIDKTAGAIGHRGKAFRAAGVGDRADLQGAYGKAGMAYTAPVTDAAKQWQGWGTALKPASEHWILVRKPCEEKTVAANVLEWGTGGLNIDGCRVNGPMGPDQSLGKPRRTDNEIYGEANGRIHPHSPLGRFPANLVFSHSPYCSDEQCDIECVIEMLDAQSGISFSRPGKKRNGKNGSWKNSIAGENFSGLSDKGGASRFFYCAKISASERNAGLEDMPDRTLAMSNAAKVAENRGETYDNATSGVNTVQTVKNHHPTVKPQKLMRYICRLITPPGGSVLDPFMGSGSTGLAALGEGFSFVGIEREAEYMEIARARIAARANGE